MPTDFCRTCLFQYGIPESKSGLLLKQNRHLLCVEIRQTRNKTLFQRTSGLESRVAFIHQAESSNACHYFTKGICSACLVSVLYQLLNILKIIFASTGQWPAQAGKWWRQGSLNSKRLQRVSRCLSVQSESEGANHIKWRTRPHPGKESTHCVWGGLVYKDADGKPAGPAR